MLSEKMIDTLVFRRMLEMNITTIPLNPFDIISVNRWQLSTYEVFAGVMGMTVEEMSNEISPRAFSFYSFSHETYFLIYNSAAPPEKINFNLAHEIGHILHGHISPAFPVMSKTDPGKLERDFLADQFARFALQV